MTVANEYVLCGDRIKGGCDWEGRNLIEITLSLKIKLENLLNWSITDTRFRKHLKNVDNNPSPLRSPRCSLDCT